MTELITVEQLVADESFQNWVNQSNEDDFNKWSTWVNVNTVHKPVIEKARMMVKILQDLKKKEVAHKKKETVLLDMKRRLSAVNGFLLTDSSIAATQHLISRRARVFNLPIRLKWASAIIFFILSSAAVLYYITGNSKLRYVTSFGEKKTFFLSDGSQVNLNANSVLSAGKIWPDKSVREVWLNGEAFFSIKHTSANQRFIVHTANGDVEVLGTMFNVYSRSGKTEVVLKSGKVKIVGNNINDTMVLKPGEMAELLAAKPPVKKSVEPEKFISWKKNILLFDNTSLEEVAVLIKDNYGYEVIVADEKIKKIKFTYTLVDNDLDLLLTTLTEALDIKIQKNNNTLFISH
jgi:transmembrane sensor